MYLVPFASGRLWEEGLQQALQTTSARYKLSSLGRERGGIGHFEGDLTALLAMHIYNMSSLSQQAKYSIPQVPRKHSSTLEDLDYPPCP